MKTQLQPLLDNFEVEIRRGAIQLMVCAVLTEKDLHGMAICESIASKSEGILTVPLGTVYPLLRRFVSINLIETYKPVDDARKTVYKLNSKGREFYAQISMIWARYSAALNKIIYTEVNN